MAAAFLVGPIAKLVDDVLTRVVPDANERLRIQAEMQAQLLQADLSQFSAQLEVDKTEAASNSMFVAGWRPAVGWTCAAAFGYTFVFQPMVAFTLSALGHPTPLPALDMSMLSTVLMGMLGLAGMRTYERVNGTIPPTKGK